MSEKQHYGLSTAVKESYEDAIEKVTAELKEQGFGILTQIDVKATMKKKLDADIDNYIILGACNPALAYQSLQTEQEMGLLLPCNVIVYDKAGTTYVSLLDPMGMVAFSGNDALCDMAEEARSRLDKVYEAMKN
jgi:uncharacterized protein (DUF302 family)